MTKNVEILSITVNPDNQSAQIEMTKESEQYIQQMFPTLTLEEAVQAYWELASTHLESSGDLKV